MTTPEATSSTASNQRTPTGTGESGGVRRRSILSKVARHNARTAQYDTRRKCRLDTLIEEEGKTGGRADNAATTGSTPSNQSSAETHDQSSDSNDRTLTDPTDETVRDQSLPLALRKEPRKTKPPDRLTYK